MPSDQKQAKGRQKKQLPRKTRVVIDRLLTEFGLLNGLLVIVGFYVAIYWHGYESAGLLLVWLPLLYGLSTLIAKRAQIVEELRASPLWFAVSQQTLPALDFEWDEELARTRSAYKYTEDDSYYFDIDGGWYHFRFRCGVSRMGTKFLKLKRERAYYVAEKYRDLLHARSLCQGYFALAWSIAIGLMFFVTFQQMGVMLAIAVWIVVLWGVLPKWSIRDRTENSEFMCREHIHLYSYYPSEEENNDRYKCVCGDEKKGLQLRLLDQPTGIYSRTNG